MIVAIHQPHYFPWLPYLEKISKADCFVILDDVQLADRSPMYRNKFLGKEGEIHSLAVDLYKQNYRNKKTRDIKVNYEQNWHIRHARFIQHSYNRHPFFFQVWPEVQLLLEKKYEYLLDLDIATIRLLCNAFGVRTQLLLQSEIAYNQDAQNSDLILDICLQTASTIYYSGRGASVQYLNIPEFEANGVKVVFQDFLCPTYKQKGSVKEFVGGLSALDMLFNVGFEEAKVLF